MGPPGWFVGMVEFFVWPKRKMRKNERERRARLHCQKLPSATLPCACDTHTVAGLTVRPHLRPHTGRRVPGPRCVRR